MSESIPAAASERGDPKHLPALDGLRGVALLLVFFDHWSVVASGDWQPLPKAQKVLFGLADAGWCGVDLFFVLSGFLITGILLDTRRRQSFFKNFYARRTLRIFPPYYLFLAVLFFSTAAAFLGSQQIWYWVYLQNWHIAFAGWPGHGIDHFWSLAVEEQFYLVWPLCVFVLGTRGILRLSLVIIVASPFVRWFCLRFGSDFVYATTITRLDPLACGAALAASLRLKDAMPWRKYAPRLIALGAVLLIGLVALSHRWTKSDPATQIFGFSFLGIFFAGILAWLASGPSGLASALSWPAARAIGKVSYAAYILHLPAFLLAEHFTGHATLSRKLVCLFLGAAFTFAGAFTSWYAFEQPLLRLKNRLAPSLTTVAYSSNTK